MNFLAVPSPVFSVVTHWAASGSPGLGFFNTREEADIAVVAMKSSGASRWLPDEPVVVERDPESRAFTALYESDSDGGANNSLDECVTLSDAQALIKGMGRAGLNDEVALSSGGGIVGAWNSGGCWHRLTVSPNGTVGDAVRRRLSGTPRWP